MSTLNLKIITIKNHLRLIYNLSRKNKNTKILYWIFLDSNRIRNYKNFLSSLPSNKNVGVVMRQQHKSGLYANSKILLQICKKKKFTFLVSSNLFLAKAIGADGVHYSKNYNFSRTDKSMIVSCSCHGFNDYRRIKTLRADLIFISPIFKTNSNLEKKPLGLKKISLLANYVKCKYSILGGVSEQNIKSLRNRGITSISGLELISKLL